MALISKIRERRKIIPRNEDQKDRPKNSNRLHIGSHLVRKYDWENRIFLFQRSLKHVIMRSLIISQSETAILIETGRFNQIPRELGTCMCGDGIQTLRHVLMIS